MAVIELSPLVLNENVFSPSANADKEVDVRGSIKFSVENKAANAGYLTFIKGSKSQNVDIPAGETRVFECPAGFKFSQKAYVHFGSNAGSMLVIQFMPST